MWCGGDQCLRPSSDDFPKLAVRQSPGATRVRESERVIGETVTTKTEEYLDEETGQHKVRTVEIVEKLIEKEVERNVSLDGAHHCMHHTRWRGLSCITNL